MLPDPIETFAQLHTSVLRLQKDILEIVYEPEAEKELRPFAAIDVARWLGVTRERLFDIARTSNLLDDGKDRAASFTFQEIAILRNFLDRSGYTPPFASFSRRSESEPTKILATMIFKGGTGKTTLSVHLSQYLVLRGYKVLLIDLDPQASATTLYGRQPATEVPDEETFHGFVCGDASFVDLITPTYWPNLDLIPGNLALATTDAEMAGRALDTNPPPAHPIYRYLSGGLSEIKGAYDVVIVDCRPDLGMTTLNALLAANGLVVPVGMSQLDIASMGEFFRFCSYILGELRPRITPKELLDFDFLKLVVSRYDGNQTGQEQCRTWLAAEMPGFVLDAEVLQTASLVHAHASMETLYEHRPDASRLGAYRRGLTAIDHVCHGLETTIWEAWGRTDQPPALGTTGDAQ